MVLEHAELRVGPERQAAFEAAFAEARPLAERAAGAQGVELWRSVEEAGRYRLLIRWESVEAHMDGFRGSADFERWRTLLSPFYVQPTRLDHLEPVVPAGAHANR